MHEQAQEGERERGRQQHDSRQQLYRLLPFAIVGVLVVAGIGLFIVATQSSYGKVPRLQVDRDVIDFGDQHLNTTVRATFNFTNTGDGTLTLNVPRTPKVIEGC
jgi:hypothetical protein